MVRYERSSRVVKVLVLALVALFAATVPGYAAVGTNVLTNGDFEANGGSLAGWRGLSGRLSLAADGEGGGSAAQAKYGGRAKRVTYGLTTSSNPVRGSKAGDAYAATAKVRSATRPRQSVCLVIRERTPRGALVQTSQRCATATTTWKSLPTARLTVRSAGDGLSLTVQRTYQRPRQRHGFTRDSFEADTLTLVKTNTPPPPADDPPSVPGNVVATAKSATAVDLSWNASTDTDGTGVAGYTIRRNGSVLATVNAPATSYADTSASPSTAYTYTVAAFDTAQKSSAPSSPASVTTPAATPADGPPSVPGNLVATAKSATAVDLSWNASTDTDGTGVAGYTIRRNGSVLATVNAPATSYADTSASPSTAYTYTVAAFDTAQKSSAPSSPASVTTPAATPDGPPTVPGKVAATARSATEVVVSWTPSTDTDGTGVAGYTITRNGSPFATVNAPAATFSDPSVAPSTTYTYTVAAVDTAQNASAPSAPVTITTPSGTTATSADDVWHLDETSGTTMADSGQTPHPGDVHNVALGQPGDPSFPGTSYGFNGASSFVSIPDAPDLNADGKDVRIALSLKTSTVPALPDYDLFRKGQAPGTEYKLELMPAGEFRCEFRTLQADGSIRGYVIQPAIDLHDGNWHRLTCDKVAGKMTATIDGTAFTKNITGSISNNYNMIIGAYSAKGGSDYYEGLLDEISFRTGG